MTMIHQVSKAMQKVLTETAEEAAEKTGFIQRQGKVTGANFCQTVVFGWLQNPEATLEEMSQSGVSVGLEITPQGLDQRFSQQASACLHDVLQAAIKETIQSESVAIPVLQRFQGVFIEDSSSITLPEELALCGVAVEAVGRPVMGQSNYKCVGICCTENLMDHT